MSKLNWIKHDGGPMPVPGDTMIMYRARDGWNNEYCKDGEPAQVFADGDDWWSENNSDQIVEYAIVKPSPSAVSLPAIDAHYTKYAIQPMEFSLANGLDAAQHTVIKYTVRYRDKGGIRDLRAAIRVLELMIEREEKAQANG